MKELNLKILGSAQIKPTILIDNKKVKSKKNKYGSYDILYTTEKDHVEVSICKYLEINGKLWFLMSMLFWLISFFGIFDVPYDRKCIVLNCKFNLELKEKNNVSVKFNTIKTQGEAVTIETDSKYEILSNFYYLDKKAKKRVVFLRIFKLISFVLVVILVAVLGVKGMFTNIN